MQQQINLVWPIITYSKGTHTSAHTHIHTYTHTSCVVVCGVCEDVSLPAEE